MKVIGSILSLCFLVGCAAPAAKEEVSTAKSITAITAEDKASITSLSEKFGVDMKAANWDALAASYTADAVLYAPNAPAVTGRDEIKKFFATFPPVKDFVAQIIEIEGYGDLAYLRGTVTMSMVMPDGKEVKDSGKYLEIYRKQADGSWLRSRDMFSTDTPVAPAK